jgi:hypothetical protein
MVFYTVNSPGKQNKIHSVLQEGDLKIVNNRFKHNFKTLFYLNKFHSVFKYIIVEICLSAMAKIPLL